MTKKIYFITNNESKFQVATEAFSNSGFKLLQKPLETPEIQSNDLSKIASFSAKWATRILKHPVFVTDNGYFIEALNGFPGPFIKHINQYLTAQDFLKLMAEKKNRKIVFKSCLAYCEPGKNPILFFSSTNGKVSTQPGKKGKNSINKIFIPNGFDRPESEIPRKQMVDFWVKNNKNYHSLIEYLKNRTCS